MAQGQFQLEKAIDEVLQDGDVQTLDIFIQRNAHEGAPVKCSLQFLTKLDKLVIRSLEQNDIKSAGLGLAVLYKCGNNLKLPGVRQGLSGIIAQGLLKKWFEKCRQLWIQCGPQWDEALFNLSEDFFDALMVVHEACKKGTCKVTESFLYPVGQLAVDPNIYILIQKEAIRRFNLILDKIPVELKREKKIVTSQEASDIMVKLAGQILKGGDYDLQTALMEALCRMATPDQRKELADRWFSMEHVASAFVKICDSKFETDCRKFLNFVNGMQGDKRRVYSYPCLEVYLDKHELLMPADEKLEEFWIDFNLGSHSISFYFSFPDDEAQESQWETICINENEVQSYSVTDEGKRKVLELMLSEVVVVGAVEGSSLIILFSSSLDILQAVRTVYGSSKNKDFVRKTGTSVVNTTVKVVMEENLSQPLSIQVVPESQMSLNESERNTAVHLLPTPSAPGQMVTPTRRRVSESTAFISSSGGGSVHGASLLSAVMSNTSVKGKVKPSLEMVHSSDRQSEFYLREPRTTAKTFINGTTSNNTTAGGLTEQSTASRLCSKNKVGKQKKTIPVAKAVDGEGEELEPSFVPDTQPRTERNIPFNWNKLSVSEILMMPTQKISLLPSSPEPHSSLAKQQEQPSSAQKPISPKQLHRELTQRLQQVLTEQNQDPQTQMSDVREDPEDKSSADRCASLLCTPKEQQAQRNGPAKGKSKQQMLVETDVPAIEAPPKASTTKALQKRGTPIVKTQADVVGSMVKLISSHYEISTQSTAKDTAGSIPKSWIPPIVNRPVFNMSWSSATKKEVSGAGSQLKYHSRITTNSQRKDIFAFDIDVPLNFGAKNKTITNTSSTSSSDTHNSSALPRISKEEQPVVKKEKRYVKKHLFSDTDYTSTDVSWLRESNRRPKPKVTKYSKQASVRPKAVSPWTSYDSPLLAGKPAKGNTKLDKKKKLNMRERVKQPNQTVKPAAPDRPGPAVKRPQRTAAISTKSYREPDTDESPSESEKPPVPKNSAHHLENDDKSHKAAQVTKKNPASKQPTRSSLKAEISRHSSLELVSEQPLTSRKHFVGQQGRSERTCLEAPDIKKRRNSNTEPSGDSYRRLESSYQSEVMKTSGVKQRPETSKLNKGNFDPSREQMNGLKDSWTASQTLFSPSPPFIERMRSAERSAPTLSMTCSPLPASPAPPEDIPSPVLLLPKPQSAVSSKGNFRPSSGAEKKHSSSKTRSIQSVPSLPSLTPISQTSAPKPPRALKISPVQQDLSSDPQSPLSLSSRPLLTSTLLELDKPSMPCPHRSPFPEDTVNHGSQYGFSKVSSASWVSLSQSSTESSVLTERVKDGPAFLAVSKTEKTPSSVREGKSEQLHVSGPSHKRHISSSSSSEQDEKDERKKSKKMRGRRSPRMKPRKLFKSFAEASAEGELSREVSPSCTMSSRRWEAEVDDGDMDEEFESLKTSVNPSNLCQQFSSELKKKFQNRYNMVEVFNKQSFKAVQQHVSSLNSQVTKHRAQRLEQVQKILLEEIQLLEQNDTLLKDMEKDLTVCWKSQTMAFHSFQERETLRNEALKKGLQSNVCHSLEHEERMFTSQMCLIRNDMKSIQDRLLSDMHEGEIQSVKRGLHALFFP